MLKFKAFYLSLFAVAMLPAAAKPQDSPQQTVDAIANTLQVRYEISANRGDGGCHLPGMTSDAIQESCFEVSLSITSPEAIGANALGRSWAIYFSQVDPLIAQAPGEFTIEHINGDLHRITPADTFTGFAAGETKTLQFIGRWVTLTEAKMMPNYYIIADGNGINTEARTITSTQVVTDPETGLEIRPYGVDIRAEQFKHSSTDKTPLANSAFLYRQNQAAAATPLDDPQQARHTLVPKPQTMIVDEGELDLAAGINLLIDGIEKQFLAAALARLEHFGIAENKNGVEVTVEVRPDSFSQENRETPAGSYQLTIDRQKIRIRAADASGAFYGLQSLAALISVGNTSVPTVHISDAPRYGYRGMHIDVARNFHSKQLLLDLLDQMAAYKLNKLHLHLGDDEGWRLEIPELPELTDIGARRCHDPSEDTCLLMQLGSGPTGNSSRDGYYSRADYIELVKAAEARHIQLIPSFDMPGHSRAAVKAMEARYRRFMAQGNQAAAEQYLLSDLQDKTQYRSIQFYSDNTINACMESPYAFIGKVIDEVQQMHAEAEQPLTVYHIGADETPGAWTESPICQQFLSNNSHGVTEIAQLLPYFVQRVATLLQNRGITTAGWSDGLGQTDPAKMPKTVHSYVWDVLPWAGVTTANTHGNRGWNVVLSLPDAFYFDFPYEADPKEGGYYWASRRVNTRKVFNFMPGNLPAMAEIYVGPEENSFEVVDHTPLQPGIQWHGLQGQLWSETIRSDEAVEYMVFPRLLALAERAWHTPDWELPYNYEGQTYNADSGYFNSQTARDADWQRFANVLGHKEFAKLDAVNIQYRIPTVGAVIEHSVLKANLPYPGLGIEYRTDGGQWQPYNFSIPVNGRVDVRGVAADGLRKGRSLRVQ